MIRTVLALGAAAALLSACTFDTPPFEDMGYLPCHQDGSCDHPGCACLDGRVCVPRQDLAEPLDPQRCQCPQGMKVCASECTDIQKDARHCGSCEKDCVALFAGAIGTPECRNAECAVACPASSADCDNDWKNGCDPLGTHEHCADCTACPENLVCTNGRCDTDCDSDEAPCGGTCCSESLSPSDAHGTATCINNQCALDCDSGYGDCNGAFGDGCETLLDDPASCRSSCLSSAVNCNSTVLHAESVTCSNGACGYTQCKPEFADCKNGPGDGCETPLRRVTSCGLNCQDIHDCAVEASNAIGAFCNTGVCDYASCKFGFGDCNNMRQDGCESDILNKREHCGACGRACSAPHSEPSVLECKNGICVIPTGACLDGFDDCDKIFSNGCEAYLNGSDPLHCGHCGTVCSAPQHARAVCSNGSCRSECLPGWMNCDEAIPDCEMRLGTNAACEDCDNTCEVNENCTATGCSTECANTRCQDQSCPDFSSNVFHCGNCEIDCSQQEPALSGHAIPRCTNGSCDFSECIPPFATCPDPNGTASGTCATNKLTDPANCGSCGNACAPGQVCTNGICGKPGASCPQADNCFDGSVCCTNTGGATTCTNDIRNCRMDQPIFTCDGPEDCMQAEQCWLLTAGLAKISLCGVSPPGSDAKPLCNSNRDCFADPENPSACCADPGFPSVNTCQPGCGTCGNQCLMGRCDHRFGLCGDFGIGICPTDCAFISADKSCCWTNDLAGQDPVCNSQSFCPDQNNTVQIECNDWLDCATAYNPEPVCCYIHSASENIIRCVPTVESCMPGGEVVCGSPGDCPTWAGSNLVCRPVTNLPGLFTCRP